MAIFSKIVTFISLFAEKRNIHETDEGPWMCREVGMYCYL